MSSLETMASEARALVREHGITPTEAAEKVVSLDDLDSAEVLFAVQRYVGSLVHGIMTSERQGRVKSPRRDRVESLVRVMESTMVNAIQILLVQKQGADGVERPLRDFTEVDHAYCRDLEAASESGARRRKDFHKLAINHLGEFQVSTIAQLPMNVQFDLGKALSGE